MSASNSNNGSRKPMFGDLLTKEPVSMNEELKEADSDHVCGRLDESTRPPVASGEGTFKERGLEPMDESKKGDEKEKGAQGSGEKQRDA
jgi:hypothetical protein